MPTSKRPCRICRRWFEPEPREGKRQRVCSLEACQRERHRRSCAAGRAVDKKRAREELLRKRLVAEDDRGAGARTPEVPGPRPRDAVTSKATVAVRELVKVLSNSLRDAVASKAHGERRPVAKVVPPGLRDATDGNGPAP